PVVCPAPDQCHVAGTCDTSTGVCSNPNATDGTSCDDSDACTFSDTCQSGVCKGTTCSTGLCGTSLSAFTGAQTSAWSFNGTAAYDSVSNTAVLVDGGQLNSAGTLVYQDAIKADAFTVSFDFRMSDTGSGRADGLMFIIETNGKTALGGIGSGLGGLGLTG